MRGDPVLLDQLARPYTVDLCPPAGVRPPAGIDPVARHGVVLLLTRAVDAEFTELLGELHAMGIPAIRIDADRLGGLAVDVRPGGGLRIDGHEVRPTVTWIRRFSPAAMPTTADSATDAFHRQSWATFALGLAGRTPVSLPGPWIDQLSQLAGAAAHGVRVPRTVVTTNPAGADLGDRVVVKTLGAHFVEPAPGQVQVVFPRIYARHELAARPAPPLPVVVQEYVPHDAEYRVYVLNGRSLSYRVHKSEPAALWLDAAAGAEHVPAPASVTHAALLLARSWRLTYAAFDFLVVDGEPVFLEANLDGDWRWFESRSGDRSVTDEAAAMIRRLHLAAGGGIGARRPPPGHDLLTFLTAGRCTGQGQT